MHAKDDLKAIVFKKAELALNAYQASLRIKVFSDEGEKLHQKFTTIYEIIKDAGLEDEFELWMEG